MVLLLILLRSAVPEIPGVVGMFIRLHQEVKTEDGRRVLLTAQVYGELNIWRHLIHSLAARPTHLRENFQHPPTWTVATETYLEGMGGV